MFTISAEAEVLETVDRLFVRSEGATNQAQVVAETGLDNDLVQEVLDQNSWRWRTQQKANGGYSAIMQR